MSNTDEAALVRGTFNRGRHPIEPNPAKTANAFEDGPAKLRSDGLSPALGFLGDFARSPALFSVYDLGPDRTQYPNGPNRYLIDVEDGVGARECCRFTDDSEDEPVWNGAWNNDAWCPWILKRAKALAAGEVRRFRRR